MYYLCSTLMELEMHICIQFSIVFCVCIQIKIDRQIRKINQSERLNMANK